MKDAVSVHMVNGLAQLVHIHFNFLFRQVALSVCEGYENEIEIVIVS